MGLVRTVPPTNPPVTLAEAKQQIGLVDAAHDQHVDRLIQAATEQAESLTWRALVTQTWRLALAGFPPCRLWIPRPPLQSLVIEYTDESGAEQTLDASQYKVAFDSVPAFVEPAYGTTWPATRPEAEAVRVTFVAGYGPDSTSVPQRVRQAILLLVANWFAHRESVVTGTIASELPQNARWLLESFKTGVPAEWFLPDGYAA